MSRTARTLTLAIAALAVAPDCTDIGDTEPFGRPAGAAFQLEGLDPAPDETGVPLDHAVDMYFSTMPDPDSPSAESFLLTSGGIQFTGGFRIDLIDRRVRYLPARDLPPHVEMRVHLGRHLRALDGRELGEDFEWGFVTGDSGSGAPPSPPEVRLSDLEPLLETRCAASCHEGPEAFQGLDLASGDAAFEDLVGRLSAERPSLLRVSAGDHARSYLARKLLAAPGIVGDRMPPPPAAPLDAVDVRRVADWIDGGARR